MVSAGRQRFASSSNCSSLLQRNQNLIASARAASLYLQGLDDHHDGFKTWSAPSMAA
jgi:hypothetical protein